jgi:hypothetical protein
MRTKTLSLVCISTLIALNSFSQAGNTGAAGSGGGTTAPATGSGTATQGSSQTTQPRTINPGQVIPPNQPGVNQPRVVQPGVNQPGFGTVTNPVLTQDQLRVNTNTLPPATNQFLVQSNQFPGQPNGVAGAGTNFPLTLTQDRAFNANDRTILVQIHRNIRPVFPSSSALAGVHFQVQQGVVTAVGTVPTMEQKQRVLQIVQTTPNVTQVVDQLRVNAPPGAPISTTGFGYQSNQAGIRPLTPTGVTNQFGINPNRVPTTLPQVPTNAIPPANNP